MLAARTHATAARSDKDPLRAAINPSQDLSPTRVRTLFISDTHLGTRACQAALLLDFLRQHEARTIYLVGDIMESWCLTTNRHWTSLHEHVMIELLEKARTGTRIIYIPGNHDHLMRRCVGQRFNGIEIELNAIHDGADGRRYLVTHGDQFDVVLRHMPWLANIGHGTYHALLALNTGLNAIRRGLGLSYWSLSEWTKRKVKHAVNHISHFEECLSTEARQANADGVICGHIHHAADRDLTSIRYLNTGDWVESCSGIVEHHDGRFEIVRWTHGQPRNAPQANSPIENIPDIRGSHAGLDVVRHFQLRIHRAVYRRSG